MLNQIVQIDCAITPVEKIGNEAMGLEILWVKRRPSEIPSYLFTVRFPCGKTTIKGNSLNVKRIGCKSIVALQCAAPALLAEKGMPLPTFPLRNMQIPNPWDNYVRGRTVFPKKQVGQLLDAVGFDVLEQAGAKSLFASPSHSRLCKSAIITRLKLGNT